MPEADSILRSKLPHFAQITEESEIFHISASERCAVPEAAVLGLPPGSVNLSDGALTVACLHAEPPARSVHFQVNLLSCDLDGVVTRDLQRVTHGELEEVWKVAKRLETSQLTLLPMTGTSIAGLVWEQGSLDLGTASASEMDQKNLRKSLPEGDGDVLLTRFIDDSVNLLTDLDLNKRRVDEGLPPLNLLWPWGHGFRSAMPNLPLRRGQVARFTSDSIRLGGLAWLCQYPHTVRESGRALLAINPEELLAARRMMEPTVVILETVKVLRGHNRLEEAMWWIRQLDTVIEPWLRNEKGERHQITLLFPGDSLASPVGLGVHFDPQNRLTNHIPLDERALEERLPSKPLWEIMHSLL